MTILSDKSKNVKKLETYMTVSVALTKGNSRWGDAMWGSQAILGGALTTTYIFGTAKGVVQPYVSPVYDPENPSMRILNVKKV